MAPETISAFWGNTAAVIVPLNESSRNILAVIAGLAKFCPIPPNRHLTTIIAKTAPTAACHSGMEAGILSASRSPVTADERSPTVCSFLQMMLKTSSESIAAATQVIITNRLFIPKNITEAADAGRSAISTSSMMERVVRLVYKCGEEVTISLFIS